MGPLPKTQGNPKTLASLLHPSRRPWASDGRRSGAASRGPLPSSSPFPPSPASSSSPTRPPSPNPALPIPLLPPNPQSVDGIADPKPPKAIKRMESSEDEEEKQEIEMVQADFEFFDPKPGDFNGVKLLLQSYLDKKPWDLSGFVDLILEQTTVGTIVKSASQDGEEEGDDDGGDDDESLFAVISALNLGRYAGHGCIKELKRFLLEVCSDESTKTKLKLLLEQQASDVGLLVSQRFVNCPYQLVPPLYDALFDEVSWATEDELFCFLKPTQELRDSFRLKYYMLLTRILENKNVNQRKAKQSQDYEEPFIYIKAEDEIFRELSLLSFTFRLHAEQLISHELKNYREMGLVMVVKADDISKFREKLKSLLAKS
ncbi:protein BCCIP homolog isoform X2 [Elaeis guineensis]|uniref:Protein BCCIP homolog isoform X2 n=1 Tax=Elaeis guineensis var. tenera TaxID=51953 RepID=A0A8N4F9F7_ELAGV|nr:protein BCCIP homolog isoform X2 [Elaeis guineensis]